MVIRAVNTEKYDIFIDFDGEYVLRMTRDFYILYYLIKINKFALQCRGIFLIIAQFAKVESLYLMLLE
jgi:hypothetical protein